MTTDIWTRRLDELCQQYGMNQAQEGIGEIEDYINEDEIDLHVHKRTSGNGSRIFLPAWVFWEPLSVWYGDLRTLNPPATRQ